MKRTLIVLSMLLVMSHYYSLPVRVESPGLFSLRIVQQTKGDITSTSGVVTQFRDANNLALLAHEELAGAEFKRLQIGDEVNIVYRDRHIVSYIVTDIQVWQALDPYNPEGKFRRTGTDKVITANTLFLIMYVNDPSSLVFQTCLGDMRYRMFVIARPITLSQAPQ